MPINHNYQNSNCFMQQYTQFSSSKANFYIGITYDQLTNALSTTPAFVNFIKHYDRTGLWTVKQLTNPYYMHEFFEQVADIYAHENLKGKKFFSYLEVQEILAGWLTYLHSYLFFTNTQVSSNFIKWLEEQVYAWDSDSWRKIPSLLTFESMQLSAETVKNLGTQMQRYTSLLPQQNLVMDDLDKVLLTQRLPSRGGKHFTSEVLQKEAEYINSIDYGNEEDTTLLRKHLHHHYYGELPLDNPFLTDKSFLDFLTFALTISTSFLRNEKLLFTVARAEMILAYFKSNPSTRPCDIEGPLIRSLTRDISLSFELRKEIAKLNPDFEHVTYLPEEKYTDAKVFFEATSEIFDLFGRIPLIENQQFLEKIVDYLVAEPYIFCSTTASGTILKNPHMTHELYWKLFQLKEFTDAVDVIAIVTPTVLKKIVNSAATVFVEPYKVNAFSLFLEYETLWHLYNDKQQEKFKNKVREYGLTTIDHEFFESNFPMDIWVEIIYHHMNSPAFPARQPIT